MSFIRSGKYENEDKLKEYIGRIDGVADQIKSLADNILLYSMTAAKQSDERCEAKSLKSIIQEELSETTDYLNQQGFEVVLSPAWPEGEIVVCESFVKRLLDNVASNISRYADPSEPVMVGFVRSSTHMGLAFRNAIAVDPNSQDGFGVGLANITSMMEAMGGFGRFQKDDDHFEIELWFLKKQAQQEP